MQGSKNGGFQMDMISSKALSGYEIFLEDDEETVGLGFDFGDDAYCGGGDGRGSGGGAGVSVGSHGGYSGGYGNGDGLSDCGIGEGYGGGYGYGWEERVVVKWSSSKL